MFLSSYHHEIFRSHNHWQSDVHAQGHRGQNKFCTNLGISALYPSLNSQMAMKWCTKLAVAQKRCPVIFRGHPSNFKVTQDKTRQIRDLIAATGLVISNWIQIVNFSARVTVIFDGWPQKTIGHFFYTTSSFVHHFKSIGEFKLDLGSRNAQFGSKLVICYPVWPWNLMDDLGKQ